MRLVVLMMWLLAPVAFGVWHFGPGQDRMRMDEVGDLLARADRLAAGEEWQDALKAYQDALERLPADRVDVSRRVRLARAKAQMQSAQLPAAHQELQALCEELQSAPDSTKLLADARSALAQSAYHMTWLMRVEGLPREAWEPKIEEARQTYRLLSEQAAECGDGAAETKAKEDLEAAVRLERMELGELQGLALPKQCCGCCSGNKPSKSQSKGKVGPKKPQDARGASSGPPPDTGGH
ncbi:MAG: hypothetical protein ACRC33_09605 [Gemmataceae bacterium]